MSELPEHLAPFVPLIVKETNSLAFNPTAQEIISISSKV